MTRCAASHGRAEPKERANHAKSRLTNQGPFASFARTAPGSVIAVRSTSGPAARPAPLPVPAAACTPPSTHCPAGGRGASHTAPAPRCRSAGSTPTAPHLVRLVRNCDPAAPDAPVPKDPRTSLFARPSLYRPAQRPPGQPARHGSAHPMSACHQARSAADPARWSGSRAVYDRSYRQGSPMFIPTQEDPIESPSPNKSDRLMPR